MVCKEQKTPRLPMMKCQGFDEVNKMLGEDYHAVGGGGPFEVYGWYTNDGCEITCQFSAEGESDEAISVIAEMATN